MNIYCNKISYWKGILPIAITSTALLLLFPAQQKLCVLDREDQKDAATNMIEEACFEILAALHELLKTAPTYLIA